MFIVVSVVVAVAAAVVAVAFAVSSVAEITIKLAILIARCRISGPGGYGKDISTHKHDRDSFFNNVCRSLIVQALQWAVGRLLHLEGSRAVDNLLLLLPILLLEKLLVVNLVSLAVLSPSLEKREKPKRPCNSLHNSRVAPNGYYILHVEDIIK